MAIADLLAKLVELKSQLVANLSSMGVTADESEKLNTLVPKVLEIETGVDTSDATATASDILKGKTAYINDVKVSGIIESKSAQTYTPTTANQTISSGVYLSETQTIKGDRNLKAANIKKGVSIFDVTGSYTSNATATASDIVAGKTAYVNGEKIVGTQSIVWSKNTVSEEVTSVTIPSGVTSIADSAFASCTSLASITIPDSVTNIGSMAFDGCSSLASIKIPSGVTSIGDYAFRFCTSLASITIPDSVTNIGSMAFNGCSSLANIYYKGTEEQWNAIAKGSYWNRNMGSNVEGGTVITYNYTG